MEKSPHFKPDQCALLLIDHQVGTTQLVKNITADQSIRNAVTLAKAALAFHMPIVMTSSQEDHVQGPIHPSLARTAPDAFSKRVQRQGVVNAWDDPNFAKAVADTGRTRNLGWGLWKKSWRPFQAQAVAAVSFSVEVTRR